MLLEALLERKLSLPIREGLVVTGSQLVIFGYCDTGCESSKR